MFEIDYEKVKTFGNTRKFSVIMKGIQENQFTNIVEAQDIYEELTLILSLDYEYKFADY